MHDPDIDNATMDTTNIVSIPNLGTDGRPWIPNSGANYGAAAVITRTAVNSQVCRQLLDLGPALTPQWRHARQLARQELLYLHRPQVVEQFQQRYNRGGGAGGQASATGDIYLSASSGGIAMRVNSQSTGTALVATDAADADANIWVFYCFTYDDTISQGTIYRNGVQVAQGTMSNRNDSPSNSGGTDINGYNTGSTGLVANYLNYKYASVVMTLEQVQTLMAQISSAASITFGSA